MDGVRRRVDCGKDWLPVHQQLHRRLLASKKACASITRRRVGGTHTMHAHPAQAAVRSQRAPKVTSYKPGATVVMAVRSFSHTKFSGLVLIFCTFHGTACLSPFTRPDFQIQRPSKCSEQRDSMINDCSPITRLSSASVGRCESSRLT